MGRLDAHHPAALVMQHFERGDHGLCVGELYQFELFVKQLTDVRASRPDVFEQLKSRMYTCAQPDNYFGLRMEARIGSSLARAGEPFTLQERPDFRIRDGAVFIECGSVWPDTSDADKDYRTRIAAAFRKKGRQRYATPQTALALEVTSIFAAMVKQGRLDDETDLNQALTSILTETSFGALLLFATAYEPEVGMLHSIYWRFESPRIDEQLQGFLDARFPRVGGAMASPFFPGQHRLPVEVNQSGQPNTGGFIT